PRGQALGYTLNLPEEDRHLKTREELIDYMSVLLGGRAAEEIVFGAITTGAADDLARVADISRAMVHEYAMGTSITSRKVSAEGGAVSDRTRQLRDEEQQHLADEAMRGAMRLITEHRVKLDQLAGALLRNEVLERPDIDKIMEGVARLHRAPGQGLRVVAATSRVEDTATAPRTTG
ncbi:MAG: cell division protease FtsH, partial [Solirubrobacteraceae bacterium]|nr:cell division protease FtsH [Solirubrobacteraceae bacterium]